MIDVFYNEKNNYLRGYIQMSKQKGTVRRNFYYYNIKPMTYNSDGKLVEVSDSSTVFYETFEKILELCNEIKTGEKLPDNLGRVVENGGKLYVLVDKVVRNEPIEFRLVLCRTDALPYVENQGLLEFLTKYLPQNFSLAEITHCVIFPQYNILGAEFNFSGARVASIKEYLPAVYSKIEHVYCTPRLNDTVLRKLRKNEDLSLFRMVLKNNSNAMREMMEEKSIFRLPFAGIKEVETFEIVFKSRKGKRTKGFKSPIPLDQIDDFIQRNRDDLKTFIISQKSVQNDAVDLLHDKFVCKADVTKTANKMIDSRSAYHIIEKFFDTDVMETIKE